MIPENPIWMLLSLSFFLIYWTSFFTLFIVFKPLVRSLVPVRILTIRLFSYYRFNIIQHIFSCWCRLNRYFKFSRLARSFDFQYLTMGSPITTTFFFVCCYWLLLLHLWWVFPLCWFDFDFLFGNHMND